MKACALMGVDPAVFDVAGLRPEDFKPGSIQMPAIFYLHGLSFGFTLVNATKEFRHKGIRTKLRKLFAEVLTNRTMIVAGYSGEDPTAQFLLQIPHFGSGLYWVTHGGEPPAQDIRAKLLERDKGAHLIADQDADEFFVTVARALDCSPLKLLENPFQQFSDLLETVCAPEGTESARQLQRAKIHARVIARESEEPAEDEGEEVLVVPDARAGLIVSLPTFSSRGANYSSPKELVDSFGEPDFREQALTTNWGPIIVAVEHHRNALRHCWIICSPEARASFDDARELVRLLVPPTDDKEVQCHQADASQPLNIVEVQKVVEQIYEKALKDYSLLPNEVIADITSGLTPLSGGMILGTLDEARPIEYLVQSIPLISKVNGKLEALSPDEIRERQVLVSIKTSGEVVQEAAWRARR
jgi:hypothetical protein